MSKYIEDNSTLKKYKVKCKWPDGIHMQCGSKGAVGTKDGGYFTAYFEAFPDNMFVRGEGKTIKEAAMDCYKQYIKYISCNGHEFEKIRKDGLGKCKKCGLKKIVFETEYTCIICGKHEHYSGILNEYMNTDTDCICEECSKKKENFKYLSDDAINLMGSSYNGILLFHPAIDKDTFDILKDNRPHSVIDLMNILEKDNNPYLTEIVKRMLLNITNNIQTEEEVIQCFYEDYVFRWIERGYPEN